MKAFVALIILSFLIVGCTSDSPVFVQTCPTWTGYPSESRCELQVRSAVSSSTMYLDLGSWDIAKLTIVGRAVIFEANIVITDINGNPVDTNSTILNGDYLVKRLGSTNVASFKIKSSSEASFSLTLFTAIRN